MRIAEWYRGGLAAATLGSAFRRRAAYTMRPDKLPAGAMSIESDPSAPPGAMRAILAPELPPSPPGTRAAITAGWIRDEAAHVRELLQQARLPAADRDAAQAVAADLGRRVCARARD